MHTHPHPQTQLVLACIAGLWLERVWLCKTNPQEVGGTFVSTVFRFAMKLGDPILVPRHGESMGTRLGWTLANRHGISMMLIYRHCVVRGYFQLCVCTLSVLIPICLAYFHPFLPPSPLSNLHIPSPSLTPPQPAHTSNGHLFNHRYWSCVSTQRLKQRTLLLRLLPPQLHHLLPPRKW